MSDQTATANGATTSTIATDMSGKRLDYQALYWDVSEHADELEQQLAAERQRAEQWIETARHANERRHEVEAELEAAENSAVEANHQFAAERQRAETLQVALRRHLSSIGAYPQDGDDLVALASKAFKIEHERAVAAEAQRAAERERVEEAERTLDREQRSHRLTQEVFAACSKALIAAEDERDRLRAEHAAAVMLLESGGIDHCLDVHGCRSVNNYVNNYGRDWLAAVKAAALAAIEQGGKGA